MILVSVDRSKSKELLETIKPVEQLHFYREIDDPKNVNNGFRASD